MLGAVMTNGVGYSPFRPAILEKNAPSLSVRFCGEGACFVAPDLRALQIEVFEMAFPLDHGALCQVVLTGQEWP